MVGWKGDALQQNTSLRLTWNNDGTLFPAAHEPVIGIYAKTTFDLLLPVTDHAVGIENRVDVPCIKGIREIEGFRLHRPHSTQTLQWLRKVLRQVLIAVSERAALVRRPRQQEQDASQHIRIKPTQPAGRPTEQHTTQHPDGERDG